MRRHRDQRRAQLVSLDADRLADAVAVPANAPHDGNVIEALCQDAQVMPAARCYGSRQLRAEERLLSRAIWAGVSQLSLTEGVAGRDLQDKRGDPVDFAEQQQRQCAQKVNFRSRKVLASVDGRQQQTTCAKGSCQRQGASADPQQLPVSTKVLDAT